MTETTDIAAIRQRADAFVHADPNAETFDTFDELIIAADDRAALLAHVDALTDDIRLFEAMKRGVTVRIQDMADANAELARKLAAAEAALRPFANVAQVVMKREPLADDRTYMSVNDNRITYGDLRTAADALAAHAGNADSGESGGA